MVLDPNNTPTVSGFDTFFNRGASIIASANLPVNILGRRGHQGITATYSNSKYAALDDLPFYLVSQLRNGNLPMPQETGSWSIAYAFDQAVRVDPCDPKRSWGLFGNAGISDGNPNPIRWAGNIGVGGSSPFRGRKLDTFGVGYYYIGVSDDVKNFAPRFVAPRDEHGVELFYNAGITPWFHITPDLQIITPTRSQTETSVNFGLRAKIDF